MKISKSIILPLLALLVTFSSLAEAVKIGECSSRGPNKEQLDNFLQTEIKNFNFTKYRSSSCETNRYSDCESLKVTLHNKDDRTVRAINAEFIVGNVTLYSLILRGKIAPNTIGEMSGKMNPSFSTYINRALNGKPLKYSLGITAYEYGYVQGDCLHVWTKEDQDRARMRQIEQDAKKSLADRRERMLHRCIVDKSKGVPENAISSVQKTCLDILDNPSFLDKIRYGD